MFEREPDTIVLYRKGRDLFVYVNESFAYARLVNFYTHLRPFYSVRHLARLRRFLRVSCHQGQERECESILREAKGMRDGEARYL